MIRELARDFLWASAAIACVTALSGCELGMDVSGLQSLMQNYSASNGLAQTGGPRPLVVSTGSTPTTTTGSSGAPAGSGTTTPSAPPLILADMPAPPPVKPVKPVKPIKPIPEKPSPEKPGKEKPPQMQEQQPLPEPHPPHMGPPDDGHPSDHGGDDHGGDDHGGGDHPDNGDPHGGGDSMPAPGEGCAPTPGADPSAQPICLGLRYVVYEDRDGTPVADAGTVRENLDEINHIWDPCGVQFQIDDLRGVQPEKYGLNFRTRSSDELNRIRRRFAGDNTLLVVSTGNWDRRGDLGSSWANAWTNMPGDGVYGAILEGKVANDPPIIAHELGHYLNLGHVDDSRDVMTPIVAENSTGLTPAQCQAARRAARYYWPDALR